MSLSFVYFVHFFHNLRKLMNKIIHKIFVISSKRIIKFNYALGPLRGPLSVMLSPAGVNFHGG